MQKYLIPISFLTIFMTFICCCKPDSASNATNVVGTEVKEVKSADKNVSMENPDTLIYCSIANEAPAGGGKNYMELINENGKTELIVATDQNNDFGETPSKKVYTLKEEDAAALLKVIKENDLLDVKVPKEKQIEMPGATEYRVRMEISGRDVFFLRWYKGYPPADRAYNIIEKQFNELVNNNK